MKQSYVYAALILHEEKKDITPESIIQILRAAGADADEAMAKSIAESLKEVDIDSILESAQLVAPIQAAPATPASAPEEKPKEEKKEEKEEEESVEGLAALFG